MIVPVTTESSAKDVKDVQECTPDKRCAHKEATCVNHQCLCAQTMKPPLPDGNCPLNKATRLASPLTVIVQPSPNHSKPISVSKGNSTVNPPIQSTNNDGAIGSTAGCVLIFIVGIICWKVFCRGSVIGHRKSDKKKILVPLEKNILLEERYTSNPQYTSAGGSGDTTVLTVPIIKRSVITDLQEIGEGFFGKVYKGQLHVIEDEVEKVETVAVKMLKQSTNLLAEEDFMREVEIMSSFRHDNILSLTGLCPRDDVNSPWMVFEYMPFGDLATVLRNSNHQFWLSVPGLPRLSPESLLFISLQIADGMEYLARQRFVHRDLACRNCLVGSGLSVKIADFGMSRDVYTCDYYKTGGTRMLPVRWMAPECIVFGKFTLESDIWSYGVVLWEIFSYGKQPYFGHSNEEVLKFILDRQLLQIPEHCPNDVTDIMSSCWKTDPKERITFSEIRDRFSRMNEVVFDHRSIARLPRPPQEFVTIDHSVFSISDRNLDNDNRDDDENYLQSCNEDDHDHDHDHDHDKLEDPFFDDDNSDDVFDEESVEFLDNEGYLKANIHVPEYWQPLPLE